MGTWDLLVGLAGAAQWGGAASTGLELVELAGAGGPQGGAWPERGTQGRGVAVTFKENHLALLSVLTCPVRDRGEDRSEDRSSGEEPGAWGGSAALGTHCQGVPVVSVDGAQSW